VTPEYGEQLTAGLLVLGRQLPMRLQMFNYRGLKDEVLTWA
jgi:hypothetical protein